MTTIAFASWKGGTGKTTLAFNITELANAAGVRTLLCDFDPQATALRQHQLRQNHSPDRTPVTTVKASMVRRRPRCTEGSPGEGQVRSDHLRYAGCGLLQHGPGAQRHGPDTDPHHAVAVRGHDHGKPGPSRGRERLENGPRSEQHPCNQAATGAHAQQPVGHGNRHRAGHRDKTGDLLGRPAHWPQRSGVPTQE